MRARSRTLLAFVVLFAGTVGLYAATFSVGVEDSFFEPNQLSINVGDTVVWNGFGAQDHTVTSDDNLFNALVFFGDVFTYTFTLPGTYPYFCENHGTVGGGGMAGAIFVSAGGVNNPPNTPLNQSPAPGATNESLTVQLRASAFSDPDAQDFHGASQWLVRRASDNAIVFNSGDDTANKTNRTVPAGVLGHGSNYTWEVRYKDGRGGWSAFSTPTAFTTLIPVGQTGVGLLARYGNSTNATLAVTTNATINFAWGATRPHRRITADNFFVLWEGSVLPQFSDRYQFQFQYRGRARLRVNNQVLVDEWHPCAFSQTRRGAIDLVAGQLAAIRIEYEAQDGGALAALRWTTPGQPMEVIPTARLFPSPP